MNYEESAAHQKIVKARVDLLMSHPFFASLSLRLQLIPDAVETCETDGRAIYYSEKYVNALPTSQLVGTIAHEVLHCALGHHCRRGNRTLGRWQYACDYAINPILKANGLEQPPGVLYKKEFEGLSAEEIYAKLPPEKPEPKSQQSTNGSSKPGFDNPGFDHPSFDNPGGNTPSNLDGKGQAQAGEDDRRKAQTSGSPNPDAPTGDEREYAQTSGVVRDAVNEDGTPASEAAKSQQQRDWAIATEQATNAAKSCGHSPLGAERILDDSRTSHQDWRAILRDFVIASTPLDYRFCPPNRRYVYLGLYLPSIYKEGMGPIVIAVDTSGSVGTEELNQFAAEISAIAEEAQPETIYVVYCDAKVQSSQEFAAGETINLKPKGGGGTNFIPAFAWVEKKSLEPACLIYLTDLACETYPANVPPYPVLWATDSRRTAQFGETIQIVP